MNRFEAIARESASDDDALVAMRDAGANAVQAIKSLMIGRGISHLEAKTKLIESPAWGEFAESHLQLHEQLDELEEEID